MYLGEQQKYIDFIVLRFIKILGLDPDQGLFFIYDIVCQYIINIRKRIGKDLPEGLTIEKAIDLFHVHCHKDECFFRYATTFVPGAGVVAAQILESLWSTLNTISPKLRTASLPHRAETLDDHACDSNNKKLLAMTDNLRAKYLDTKDMTSQAAESYTKIARTIAPATLNIWEQQIQLAEHTRVKNINVMDIYSAQIPLSGTKKTGAETGTASVPGTGTGTDSSSESESTPQDKWMEFALIVEETQCVYLCTDEKIKIYNTFRIQLQDIVRRSSSPEEHEIIDEKRAALMAMFMQLKDLQTQAGITENSVHQKPILDNETEYDEYEESTNQTPPAFTSIERKVIFLPSNGNVENDVSELEIKFRIRQADTELNQLRDLIADISFQFSHVIRGQIRKNVRTRSQKRIKSIHNQLTLHARIYARCRNHLVSLNCGDSILRQYRILTKEDLKSSTAILDPNQPGSTSLKLSWIWHSAKWLLLNDNAFSGHVCDTSASDGPNADPDAAMGPVIDAATGPVNNSRSGPVTNAGPVIDSRSGPVTDAGTLLECKFFN